jgi:folate-binding protein YgfZ
VNIRAPDLTHLSVLRFAGADALAFLQGQVSNDTRRLADGFPLLAAYSSAQGRVVAVLHLLPHSSGVLAILPREIALPTLERIKRFVLRAKVKIEDVSEQYAVAGAHDASALDPGLVPPAGAAAAHAAYLERDGFAVARVTDGTQSAAPRYWVVRRREGDSAASGVPAERHAELAWRLADIRAGMPQVFGATSEQFVAQMLNLDLLDAISFSKGCYTGQEIIARTQHLGRIKRRLSRLRLPAGSWSIGQPLRLADGRTGRLTDVVPVGGGYEALAVLSLDATGAADADTSGGTGAGIGAGAGDTVSAEELPLPYRQSAATDPSATDQSAATE